jgi:hypothetical protein
LRSEIGFASTPEQYGQRVSDLLQIPPSTVNLRVVEKPLIDNVKTIVGWKDGENREYFAYMSDEKVEQLRIWETSMSGEQLVACMGMPSHYFANTGWEQSGPFREVYLFFPNKGIVTSGRQRFSPSEVKAAPALDSTFSFNEVVLAQPDSIQQLARRVWGEQSEEILNLVKPWPGGWQAIEVPPFPQ